MNKRIYLNNKESRYAITDEGKVINLITNKELKGTYDRNEYHTYYLVLDGKQYCCMAHRLVAEYFIENDDKEHKTIVHHIDGDKHNNCVSNLKWVTPSENNLKDNKINNTKKERKVNWIYPEAQQKQCVGYSNYLINEYGEIKRIEPHLFLSGSERNGYIRYTLIDDDNNRKTCSAHRLVYETFIGSIKDGNVIDHIDGNKNNNHISNLRCISQSENAINAQRNGHKGQHKVAQYDLNNNLIKEYPSFTAAAKEFGVSYAAISGAAKRGRTSCGYKWKEI